MPCISTRLRRFLATLVCVCALLPVSAARDDAPHWVRVSSAHFSVLTDAGEKKGREVVLRFEQMRTEFAQLFLKTKVTLAEPLEIIALKSDEEYVRVAPVREGQPISAPGFFLSGEDRNYIVLDLFAEDSWRAVSHQFAHLLLNYNYPPTPGWFDEGFAEYFSSLRLSDKQAQIGADPELGLSWQEDMMGNQKEIHNPPKPLTELLSGPAWVAIPDLFTVSHETSAYQEGSHHTLFYAESWMVMHYLLNKNKLSETGTYFGLVQIQKVSVEEAIKQAYGMTATQFEQAVKDYFHSLHPLFQAQDAAKQRGTTGPGGEVYQFPAPLGPDDIGSSVQPVQEANAEALLAEMALRLPEHREKAGTQLATICADPKTENAIAHRALGWVHMERREFEAASQELAKASELDGQDPWVRYYLALVKYHQSQPGDETFHGLPNMIQDLRAVLDWDPEFAEAYNLLAMARLEGGGINSAMESMREAIRLSPRNQQYQIHMAQILMGGKKWDEATALLERLKGSSNPQVAQAARKNLEDLPTIKKYGLRPQPAASAPPVTARSSPMQPAGSPSQPPERNAEEDSSDRPLPQTAPVPDPRKVQFLKGKLLKVDCTHAPEAILTVAAGSKTMKLRTQNYKSLLLIGQDEFSCAWENLPVSVNYRAGGKADGDLVSVEVQ